MPNTPPRRTRLEPEARQQQILDSAARIIASEGLTAVSMERIARDTGVSKALVYAYFSSQTNLLKALLKRDLERIQNSQMQAAISARTFEELVQNTTRVALRETARRGHVLRRLLGEAAIVNSLQTVRTHEHETNVRYLARRISKEFRIPIEAAMVLTEIGLGLTIAAGETLQSSGAPIEEVEEVTVAMIIAAVKAGAERYRSGGLASG